MKHKNHLTITAYQQKKKHIFGTLSQAELAELMKAYSENNDANYETNLIKLGVVNEEEPSGINMYPINFEAKEKIADVIEQYNQKQRDDGKEENVITYSDLVGAMMNSVTAIIDIISYVLIAFVSVSLIVSSIMIGIITYISVLERVKEIGILRAIGASKKDISRVFNAETLIIGLTAGLIGIGVTLLICIPANIAIKQLAGVSNIASLPIMRRNNTSRNKRNTHNNCRTNTIKTRSEEGSSRSPKIRIIRTRISKLRKP